MPCERLWRSHSFHCDLHRLKWKTNEHSINIKKAPGTLSYTAHANRTGICGKATTPETVAQGSQLFSATESPFTRKNTMCRADPIHWNCIHDVAVPMQFAKNDLQTCKTQAESQQLCTLFYSSLLYSTSTPALLLLYLYLSLYPYSISTLPLPLPLPLHLLYLCRYPCSTYTLLYSTLLYSMMPYSYSSLLYAALLYASLLCSYILYSGLLYSSLLYLFSTSCRCLFSTLPLLGSALLHLYAALPLLYPCPFSTSRRCPVDTMIFGLVGCDFMIS